jgi:hypothetical protein
MVDSMRLCSTKKGTFILPSHCEQAAIYNKNVKYIQLQYSRYNVDRISGGMRYQ